VSIKGCPLACSSFHSTRNDPTDSCCFSFRSTRRPAGGCTGSLTVVAPLVPGITSDVTSTLRIAAPSMPRLAVATDQVVHGVGNLCKREGDCFQPLGLVLGVDLPDPLG
jgi:hypothetical protein